MKEALELSGVVLKAVPYKEFDKRLEILTRERGRITAFVRGARRLNSPHMAACNPFVFGRFSVYEGKNAYTLVSEHPTDFFDGIARCQPGVYYGFYFLELASYFIQEEEPSEEMVDLLYVALKAIMKENLPLPLIRRIYELRILKINGTYAVPEERGAMDDSAYYALRYVMAVPVTKLFTFTLSAEAMRDFEKEVRSQINRHVQGTMKSRDLIDEVF